MSKWNILLNVGKVVANSFHIKRCLVPGIAVLVLLHHLQFHLLLLLSSFKIRKDDKSSTTFSRFHRHQMTTSSMFHESHTRTKQCSTTTSEMEHDLWYDLLRQQQVRFQHWR
jgi:hypothetical protein